MGAWRAYRSGWSRLWEHRNLVVLFYIPGLVLAYIAAYPLRRALVASVGHSLYGDRLAHGLDLAFLGDLSFEHPSLLGLLLGLAVIGALIYLMTVTFLLGGAIQNLLCPARKPLGEALGGSASFFGCFLRLFLLSLPVYAVATTVGWGVAKGALAVADLAGGPAMWSSARAIAAACVLFALFLVNLTFDYAKLNAVRNNDRRAFVAFRNSLRFVFGGSRFGRVLALYFLVVLTGLLAIIAYNAGASLLDGPSSISIAFLVLWQQIFILVRIAVKLLFYSSQGLLLESEEPRLEPVEPVEFLA